MQYFLRGRIRANVILLAGKGFISKTGHQSITFMSLVVTFLLLFSPTINMNGYTINNNLQSENRHIFNHIFTTFFTTFLPHFLPQQIITSLLFVTRIKGCPGARYPQLSLHLTTWIDNEIICDVILGPFMSCAGLGLQWGKGFIEYSTINRKEQ